MHTIKVFGKELQVEGSWTEVNYKRYGEIANARELPFIERLSAFSRVDVGTLNRLPFAGIESIIRLTSWMQTDDLLQVTLQPYKNTTFDIGALPYGKLEVCKQRINKAHGNILAVGCDVWNVYFNEDISGLPVCQSLPKVHFIADAIAKFLDKFKKLNEYQYSEDEIEAGIETFEGFGSFPTIVNLAERFGKSYEYVTDVMTATMVYHTLLYDFERSEYGKRLQEIKERNSKLQQP
jgi:hypothetical protein